MHERATAFGRQLVEIHERLRDGFEELRAELAAGGVPGGRSLPEHCLAFCAAVERHHTAEDRETFPAVLAAYPELADVVATLARDHELVSGMLRNVTAVVEQAAAGGDRTRAVLELDGLGALLESHFTYEERKLAALLTPLNAGPRE